MRGQLLIDKETGQKWLFIAKAHLQLFVARGADDLWKIAAFRTDTYFRVEGGYVPTEQHLWHSCQWTTGLDVPDHLVAFAVESEHLRQESVSGIEDILRTTLEAKDPKAGLQEFRALVASDKAVQSEEAEHRVGEELHQLMSFHHLLKFHEPKRVVAVKIRQTLRPSSCRCMLSRPLCSEIHQQSQKEDQYK